MTSLTNSEQIQRIKDLAFIYSDWRKTMRKRLDARKQNLNRNENGNINAIGQITAIASNQKHDRYSGNNVKTDGNVENRGMQSEMEISGVLPKIDPKLKFLCKALGKQLIKSNNARTEQEKQIMEQKIHKNGDSRNAHKTTCNLKMKNGPSGPHANEALKLETVVQSLATNASRVVIDSINDGMQ